MTRIEPGLMGAMRDQTGRLLVTAVSVRPDPNPPSVAEAARRCLREKFSVSARWFALREWIGLPVQRMGL